MNNEIVEIKNNVNKLEGLLTKLAQSSGLQGEVLQELIGNIGGEIKNQVKEEMVTRTQEIKGEVLTSIGCTITETVKNEVSRRGLNGREIKRLTNERNHKMYQLLGNSKSDRYVIFAPFYFSQIGKDFRKQFEVSAYGDVDANRFDEAIEFFKNFTISAEYHEWCTTTIQKNYMDNEIESMKKLNAYKRYFSIVAA